MPKTWHQMINCNDLIKHFIHSLSNRDFATSEKPIFILLSNFAKFNAATICIVWTSHRTISFQPIFFFF